MADLRQLPSLWLSKACFAWFLGVFSSTHLSPPTPVKNSSDNWFIFHNEHPHCLKPQIVSFGTFEFVLWNVSYPFGPLFYINLDFEINIQNVLFYYIKPKVTDRIEWSVYRCYRKYHYIHLAVGRDCFLCIIVCILYGPINIYDHHYVRSHSGWDY